MFGFVVNACGRVIEGAISRAIGDSVYNICEDVFRRNIILVEIYLDTAVGKVFNRVDKAVDEAINNELKNREEEENHDSE